MSKLEKNSNSVVNDIQPQDISAHKLWSEVLSQEQQNKPLHQKDKNLKDVKEVFEQCRNQTKTS